MTDYPEHRLGFFHFLKAANEHCFVGLFNVSPEYQKLIVDSIVWAFKVSLFLFPFKYPLKVSHYYSIQSEMYSRLV
jgi:hypothetical protein